MYNEHTVIILTSHFPYYPGEQFLEEEIKYWGKYFKGNVLIVPLNSNGIPRTIPDNTTVKLLSRRTGLLLKLALIIKTAFSSIFINEIFFLVFDRKEIRFRLFKQAFASTFEVFNLASRYKQTLENYLRRGAAVYSYWNNASCYAIAQIKKSSRNYRITLISRAHRYDVYEQFKPFQYMPLKRQLKDEFDRVLAISEEGKSYLCGRYDMRNVNVERLGVNVKDTILNLGNEGEIVVLSISNCIQIKRIDRIIGAIHCYAANNHRAKVYWHHIGDGVELESLKKLSRELLNGLNVTWQFHGNKTNSQVHAFLRNHKIDVFVNASESEGVPVSIMEAMSYGIPAIAPDVGGIRELILPDNGILLTSSPTESEFALAIGSPLFYRNTAVRQAAKRHIESKYDSEKNYKNLVDMFNDVLN